MRVALLGATGRTGTLVLETALRRGHSVTALARDPAALVQHADVTPVVGDAREAAALDELLEGADAVISTLGPRGRDDALQTSVARALVQAMTGSGVRRFVGVSVAGLDVHGDRKGPRDRAIGAVVRALARGAAADRAGELAAWQESDLAWTLVRVPRLVDGPSDDGVEVDAHVPPRRPRLHRAALAELLVDLASDGRFAAAAPFAADR